MIVALVVGAAMGRAEEGAADAGRTLREAQEAYLRGEYETARKLLPPLARTLPQAWRVPRFCFVRAHRDPPECRPRLPRGSRSLQLEPPIPSDHS